MNRSEFVKAASSRIEPYRLEQLGITCYIRKLTARARARIADLRSTWPQDPDNPDLLKPSNEQALEVQCAVIADALVDENGARLFTLEDALALSDLIPGDELDELARKIVSVSGLTSVAQAEKNSETTPNGSSSSDSAPGSDGGTSTSSSAN